MHGDLEGGLRHPWGYFRRKRYGRQSERCMVIWEAVLDPHGCLKGARRSVRLTAVWEAVSDVHCDLGCGLRPAWGYERRKEV